jgi:hypothetical protein
MSAKTLRASVTPSAVAGGSWRIAMAETTRSHAAPDMTLFSSCGMREWRSRRALKASLASRRAVLVLGLAVGMRGVPLGQGLAARCSASITALPSVHRLPRRCSSIVLTDLLALPDGMLAGIRLLICRGTGSVPVATVIGTVRLAEV